QRTQQQLQPPEPAAVEHRRLLHLLLNATPTVAPQRFAGCVVVVVVPVIPRPLPDGRQRRPRSSASAFPPAPRASTSLRMRRAASRSPRRYPTFTETRAWS